MRTGLITFHFAHHYGAQLQALATMRAIQSLGHDCEIIDYRLPHTTRTNQLFKKSGGVRGMASDAHTALHYGAFQRRFRRFEAFVAEEMALSPRRYTAFEQLRADPPAYDVYVAGSDQIWNPYIFQDKQFDPSFLLGFVREGRRIAYAPSLGVPELPEDKAEELRRFLTPFSALSVREKRGQVLLREAAGRDARVVLDPTLLLTGEDWGELAAAPKRQGPYILCYFVSDPGEAAPYALALSARTGWPIVQLAGARRKIDGAAELVFDAGPREFLGLFRHASAVVTNSFHGAAFSLQFQKDFFTSMSPRERAEPTFSRIYSLLSRLGCADRILGLDTTAPVDAPIDYGAVYEKLAVARADSLSYLGAAIEGAPLPAEEPEPQAAPRPVLCRAEDCTGWTARAAGEVKTGQGGGLRRLHRLCVGLPRGRYLHAAGSRGLSPARGRGELHSVPQMRGGVPHPPAPGARPRPGGGPRGLESRRGRAGGQLLGRLLLPAGPARAGAGGRGVRRGAGRGHDRPPRVRPHGGGAGPHAGLQVRPKRSGRQLFPGQGAAGGGDGGALLRRTLPGGRAQTLLGEGLPQPAHL